MRVVYAGGIVCEPETFKRLLILANEICFSDRPSVVFPGGWGTVGVRTPVVELTIGPGEKFVEPIKVTVHSPPSGPVGQVYQRFIETDLVSREIRQAFLDGLSSDPVLRERVFPSAAIFHTVTGKQVADALIADKAALLEADLGDPVSMGAAFAIESAEGRRDTLRAALATASIDVTSALLAAEELDLAPVTDSPALERLLALRVPDQARDQTSAAGLGFEIVRAVIPDEALQKLDEADLVTFRRKTRDVYAGWELEVRRLDAQLDEPTDDLRARARTLVASELAPKMKAYRDELASARDSLFPDLVKSVLDWKVPALALGIIYHQPLLWAAAAVAGGTVLKGAADYWKSRRDTTRRHGLAYLVKLVDLVER